MLVPVPAETGKWNKSSAKWQIVLKFKLFHFTKKEQRTRRGGGRCLLHGVSHSTMLLFKLILPRLVKKKKWVQFSKQVLNTCSLKSLPNVFVENCINIKGRTRVISTLFFISRRLRFEIQPFTRMHLLPLEAKFTSQFRF